MVLYPFQRRRRLISHSRIALAGKSSEIAAVRKLLGYQYTQTGLPRSTKSLDPRERSRSCRLSNKKLNRDAHCHSGVTKFGSIMKIGRTHVRASFSAARMAGVIMKAQTFYETKGWSAHRPCFACHGNQKEFSSSSKSETN